MALADLIEEVRGSNPFQRARLNGLGPDPALEDLPTDQKEVIVLGVFQDLSYAQMEEITGTKAVTLRSRMFHGLRKLAKMIGAEIDGPVED